MSGDAARSPRDEAERLVAAALAAASVAARNATAFATGSAECCVCPVCRVIAAMREPNPDLAERLAGTAGDLAAGIAGVLRAVSAPSNNVDETGEPPKPDQAPAGDDRDGAGPDEDPWRAATRGRGW